MAPDNSRVAPHTKSNSRAEAASILVRLTQATFLVSPIPLGWAVAKLQSVTGPVAYASWVGLAVVYGACLVSALRLRPPSLLILRIAAAAALIWGILVVLSGRIVAGEVVALWGAIALPLTMAPRIADEAALRCGAQGERRLPLAIPAPLFVFAVLPALLVVGLIAGLPLALLTGARPGLAGWAVLAVAFVLSIPMTLSLYRLGRRWLVVVPSGVLIHDYLLLVETYRFSPDELAWVEPAGARWRQKAAEGERIEVADLTAGCLTPPLLLVLAEPLPPPMVRRGRKFHRKIDVVAVSPANRVLALRILQGAGYIRDVTERDVLSDADLLSLTPKRADSRKRDVEDRDERD